MSTDTVFIISKCLLSPEMRVSSIVNFLETSNYSNGHLHILLRCALALSPTSADVERLFSLLNRINSADRRHREMDMLEKLLVVARDAAPLYE